MFLPDHSDDYLPSESTSARQKRDTDDENKVISMFKRLNVFTKDNSQTELQNIAARDLATDVIQTSLLHAETLGQTQINDFVEHRFLATQGESQYTELGSPLDKKVHSFSSLYYIQKESKGKQKNIKVDRNIQQRLITAYKAGRQVNLGNVLKHELMSVPVSLAEMDDSLRVWNKPSLIDVLIQNVSTPSEIEIKAPSTVIIDGQALVMALGKPKRLNTFGDL